jgi:hypothetical protein
MEKGEVLKPDRKDPCYCCGEADKRGLPWFSIFTLCCGTYYGACCYGSMLSFGPQSTAAMTFTMAAFVSVKRHFGLNWAPDRCSYCLLSYCCCCNLCIQVRARAAAGALRALSHVRARTDDAGRQNNPPIVNRRSAAALDGRWDLSRCSAPGGDGG